MVRQAVDDDLDSLFRMSLELQDHVETSNPKIWRLSKSGRESIRIEIADALHDDNTMIFVAVNEDNTVGMAIGQILRKEKMKVKMVGAINRVIVKKGWRRKGIGLKLVAALSNFFNENGVEDITLRYIIGNSEAEAFWEGLGFEPRIKIANVTPNKLGENLKKHMSVSKLIGEGMSK